MSEVKTVPIDFQKGLVWGRNTGLAEPALDALRWRDASESKNGELKNRVPKVFEVHRRPGATCRDTAQRLLIRGVP